MLMNCSGDKIEFKSEKKGGFYEIGENGKKFTLYKSDQSVKLDTTTYIPFAEFDKISIEESDDEKTHILDFKLNDLGSAKFKHMTERNLSKNICLVVNDQIMSAATVESVISDGKVHLMIEDKKGLDNIISYLQQ